jgi:hypothetical protein
MYGCKAARKKETEKDSSKLRCQIFLSKEIVLGHPCIPCARLTRVTIRDGSENKGVELVRGRGGADTRRKGLKEDFM